MSRDQGTESEIMLFDGVKPHVTKWLIDCGLASVFLVSQGRSSLNFKAFFLEKVGYSKYIQQQSTTGQIFNPPNSCFSQQNKKRWWNASRNVSDVEKKEKWRELLNFVKWLMFTHVLVTLEVCFRSDICRVTYTTITTQTNVDKH